MSMSDSPTAVQAAEHDEEAGAGIDWKAVFDYDDLDYGHANRTPIEQALFLSDERPDDMDEAEAMSQAIENGDLVRHKGGFHLAGVEPTPPQPDEPAEADESELSTDSEETKVVSVSKLKELEQRVETAEQRSTIAVQAIGALTGVDSGGGIVVDELVHSATNTSKRIDRVSRQATKAVTQLESLGDFTEDEKPTKQGRIKMLQRYLVEKATENGGTFAMDYNAVQSFFEAKGHKTSDSYASNLLRATADDHHAFRIKKGTGNQKVEVQTQKIQSGVFFSVKKDSEGGAA